MDSENASSSSQTTLDYVRVLFAGEQRLRSSKVVMICFVMAVFSVTFGLVAMGSLGMATPAKFRLVFGIGSLFPAAMALFLTINFLIDRRMAFEVTTAGIRNGNRRTVPWARGMKRYRGPFYFYKCQD